MSFNIFRSFVGCEDMTTNINLPFPPPRPNLHFTAERERKQSDKIRMVAAAITNLSKAEIAAADCVIKSLLNFGENVV